VSLASKKERDLAVTLIEGMAAPFEPEKFKDTFREKLGEIISAKLQGQEISVEQAVPKPAAAVDIMEALQQSLAMRRKPMASEASAPKSKKKARR